MKDSLNTLKELASSVRNATKEGENSAERIGRLFEGILEYIKTPESIENYFELKQDSNGLDYIYTKYNIASAGALSMYASDKINVPSIYDGLPIDNDTIYWHEVDGSKVLKAKGGGGEAGSVQWDNISGKPSWIEDTKPSYSWSDITGEKPFYTKEEIASKYVTIDTEQEITALKHFTAGLSVGESKKKIYEENGVVYIDADVAVTGAMTFYASAGRSVSTIMDGVTVDEETITKGSDNVLRIKNAGAGSSFDENAMWSALSGSSDNQINKSHLTNALAGYATESWVTGKGYATESWVTSKNYATTEALNSVSNKLNDFLEGSDTDNIINKWKELEAFLSGMAETDNLAEILETKADKKYVDSTFVTLGTKQTITGEKTFSSVLNTAAIKASGAITAPSLAASDWVTIAGIKLRKLEDGALILEGNLALTGALTMYATGAQGFDTIYDGLPIDNDTIYWSEVEGSKVLKAKEGSGSSFDKSAMWTALAGSTTEQINKSHLTTALTGYATESWVTGKNYAVKATTLAGYGITDGINAVSVTGTGNAVTDASVKGHILTLTKGSTFSLSGHKHAWADITSGKPTTLAGYGITDAYTKTESDNKYLLKTSYTAADVLAKLKTVDGHGSGVDADTLDGTEKSGLFTAFSYSQSILSTTIGGVSKSVKITGSFPNISGVSMNTIASYGNSMGMANLTGNSANVNPNGQTNWHHFINISYNTESNNMWQSQIAIKAGTTEVWVRSRSGGTISDSVAWAAPWVRLARITDNVYSASKLQTPSSLWGNNFDGTAPVSGDITLGYGKGIYCTSNDERWLLQTKRTDNTQINGIKTNGFQMCTYFGNTKTMQFYSGIIYSYVDFRAEKDLYINGIRLHKTADGVITLEGNLAVTGGVTMYAIDPVSASTIMDGVVVDGTTIKKENGKLVAVGGGEAGSVAWGNISGKPSVFATNIANITDLHSSWDAVLKAAPSAYVTRWPTISEVTNKQNLVIKLNGGTTEGTNQFTYNATGAKTINITPAGIGAAASSHSHNAISASLTGTNALNMVYAQIADNDYFRLRVGGTASNAGYVEFATADDGNEPIYFRQYTGTFTTVKRTLTLLDGSGNSSFPGTVTASTFNGNLNGNASNADKLDGLHANSFLRTISQEGYYGIVFPDGSSNSWIRTPQSGIIPYSSTVKSSLGTGIWKFGEGYIETVICTTTKASDWFRSTGNTGWVNDSYGGGIYMTDATWVRVWNGKGFLCENTIESSYKLNARQLVNVYGALGYAWGSGQAAFQVAIPTNENQTPILLAYNGVNGNQTGNDRYFAIEVLNTGLRNVHFNVSGKETVRMRANYFEVNGDILATGGTTFYGSDIRYKSIIHPVMLLALNKIAEAPSFVYRWNRPNMNQNRLNLGGSAQYAQKILPWAVNDNDNFLSMDYATVAYTFAVHTARHLLTYETRTDKKIKKLEREIKILKRELKKLGYEEASIVDDQSV